ncbi:winged helix-turn-helix domain-containing protein [Pseudoduganella sp. LjRoot289]|uniref:winged helix-turn-helix domain-containing protein n=1 Tax=Pseudoduganella sp. LjRoot289 TaxID=3342314 RepID=UPI003ECFCF12
MDTLTIAKLRVGAWCVDTALGEMTRDGASVRLDPRTLRLLLCLTGRAGETVSADELLGQVWPGVVVTPDSVYQAIASLRRLLGDDAKQASYIVTVPRQGYRMVAAVGPWIEPGELAPGDIDAVLPPSAQHAGVAARPLPTPRSRRAFMLAASIPVVAGIAFWMSGTQPTKAVPSANTQAAQYQQSIAVLPFSDLTDGMGHETFADGMTEELIGRFSKIPGFRVPAPTSSFYYKGKQKPVADIARELGVAYILDGSVRKSGSTLRVAARLIKADNGFIIWSETYDKPVDDLLMVQDDIAGAVTKALKATISNGAGAAQSGTAPAS